MPNKLFLEAFDLLFFDENCQAASYPDEFPKRGVMMKEEDRFRHDTWVRNRVWAEKHHGTFVDHYPNEWVAVHDCAVVWHGRDRSQGETCLRKLYTNLFFALAMTVSSDEIATSETEEGEPPPLTEAWMRNRDWTTEHYDALVIAHPGAWIAVSGGAVVWYGEDRAVSEACLLMQDPNIFFHLFPMGKKE